MIFRRLLVFLQNSKHAYRISTRVANRLDPDQARRFVGPDPDPTCLQRLSADDTSKQRIKLKNQIILFVHQVQTTEDHGSYTSTCCSNLETMNW